MLKFKKFFIETQNLDYVNALETVFNLLGLPSPKEDRSEVESILSMPLAGYGNTALQKIVKEPSIQKMPNYQTEILPALANRSSTVGRLVALLSKNPQTSSDKNEPDEYTPEPDNNHGAF